MGQLASSLFNLFNNMLSRNDTVLVYVLYVNKNWIQLGLVEVLLQDMRMKQEKNLS